VAHGELHDRVDGRHNAVLLKNGNFDAQEFLRILPEIADQQPQISS
jgi:hypothetical protein